MNQKQYSDMTVIMEFCRVFSDQMYKCMENAGLNKQGYHLTICVGDNFLGEETGTTIHCSVELEKSIRETDIKDYHSTRMDQWRKNNEGWIVYADPRVFAGSEPPVVRSVEKKGSKQKSGTGAGKEIAPDSLWLSDLDDNPSVGGWV